MTQNIELVGGPLDGNRYAVQDGQQMLVVRSPRFDPEFWRYEAEAEYPVSLDYTEHAYQQDPVLDWRFVYAGERVMR